MFICLQRNVLSFIKCKDTAKKPGRDVIWARVLNNSVKKIICSLLMLSIQFEK